MTLTSFFKFCKELIQVIMFWFAWVAQMMEPIKKSFDLWVVREATSNYFHEVLFSNRHLLDKALKPHVLPR